MLHYRAQDEIHVSEIPAKQLEILTEANQVLLDRDIIKVDREKHPELNKRIKLVGNIFFRVFCKSGQVSENLGSCLRAIMKNLAYIKQVHWHICAY